MKLRLLAKLGLVPMAILLLAGSVFPCDAYTRFEDLFAAREIIRATAVGYLDPNEGLKFGRKVSTILFRREETLKGGRLGKNFVLYGYLSDEDDFNELEVPYQYVRKGGQSGDCFARSYKQGEQYLLFLNLGKYGWTTDISALGPSNEQLLGSNDPWLEWVRGELERLK